jgi:serine/threonine-protein kinase RsbW
MSHREVRIESRQAEIRRVVALVEELGAQHQLPMAIVNDVCVALDEVLSNIVAHGYEPEAGGDIVARLDCDAGGFRIEVEDGGKAFDPLQAPPPDLSAALRERKVGGLGIHLIRNLMDRVAYQRIDGKNRLRMAKSTRSENSQQERGMGSNLEIDGVVILAPDGRIDSTNAKPFGDNIVELIQAGSHHLLVDLRNIAYVSSAGFRAFLIARKLMDDVNGKIVLCGMSPELNRLFEIGHFTDLFVICATRDEGLAKAR